VKVLLDVNVVLDVLFDRKPFIHASASVWAAVEAKRAQGFLATHAVTTIHYLVRKETGSAAPTKEIIESLLRVFGVAAVDETVIERALDLSATDFEDAVTAAAAEVANCDLIVTRDPKGFRGSPVQVMTPECAALLLSAA